MSILFLGYIYEILSNQSFSVVDFLFIVTPIV